MGPSELDVGLLYSLIHELQNTGVDTTARAGLLTKADISKMFYPNNQYGGIVVTNFNTIGVSGFYTGYGTATGAPNTASSWYLIHVNSNTSTTYGFQIAKAYGAATGLYYRVKSDGTWGSWGLCPASDVGVADAGNLITATNVEGALQETATKILEKTGYGVYSGLDVTAQSTPNMTVAVATGTIYMSDGTRFSFADAATLTISAADATNPRIDIVYISSAGIRSYLAGAAAASPVAPNVPSGGQKLAEITVAANVTTIVATNIADKRKTLFCDPWVAPTLQNGATQDSVRTVQYTKDSQGFVHFRGLLTAPAGGSVVSFQPAVGYRPVRATMFPCATATGVNNVSVFANGPVWAGSTSSSTTVNLDSICYKAEA